MLKIRKTKEYNRTKSKLDLKPNHFNFFSQYGRYWNSKKKGTAYRDGKGWYITKEEVKKRNG